MARKTPAKSVEMDAHVRVLAVHGPEDAIKKEKIDQLRAALEKEHGEVQRFTFDGKIATLAEVFDEVRGYSLMGGYKLVIVDPADDFVKAHREPLERYAQNPVDHATLVLRAVGWNRGNLDKYIAKVGAVIKCEPPKPAEAVARLVARAKDVHGMSIERPAAQLMVDRLGVHLVRLETELDKLAAMAGDGGLGEALEAAEEMLAEGAVADAAQTFAAILAEDPESAVALGGLARAQLALGEVDAAEALLEAHESLANTPELEAARAQIALARQAAGAGPLGDLQAAVEANPDDHQQRFDYATALHADGKVEEAVDQLLELFKRDREWNDAAAKTQLFTIFDALKPQDPVALNGRRRLSSMIFM